VAKYGEEEDREAYKQKKASKEWVAKAKHSSWEEWQRRSSEPKQRVDLFRIAKQIKRFKLDVIGGKYIKNKKVKIKVNEKEIMKWWKEYFSELLQEHTNISCMKWQRLRHH